MRKNLKKLLILTMILGILIAGIAAFFILNSTPDELSEAQKEEAVAEILGRKPNLNPDIKTGNVEFVGEKLRFSYPAKAVIYESQGNADKASTLDHFSFDIENPRLVLNYTASEKSSLNSLNDEPAVKLREDESRGYTGEEVEINGIAGMSYKKEGGGGNRAENSAFFLKDGVIYTISVTGASLDDVDELLSQIISSASFK